MKHILKLFTILFAPLIFTSCIDYVQSVSYINGKYRLYYKMTLPKTILSMFEKDPEDLFNDFDEDFDDLPKNVKINPVNTDLEVGVEIALSIDPKTKDEAEISLLPMVAQKKGYIPFPLGDEMLADDIKTLKDSAAQELSEAILSCAKFRIIISKNVLPDIETAYFEGRGGQNYAIAFFDYGESYCLEIPSTVLFKSEMYKFDKVVVVLK